MLRFPAGGPQAALDEMEHGQVLPIGQVGVLLGRHGQPLLGSAAHLRDPAIIPRLEGNRGGSGFFLAWAGQ